jgi:putative membrane protein
VRTVYRVVQNAFVAPVLFVGLIAFWLTPAVHFDAMLSGRLYAVMNWSMLIDGLLFWMLMLDPRTREQGALLALGPRVLIVLAASIPQILIGAHITFAAGDLYDVYDVCGRAWDVSARTDQRLGGLITWIPAAMMHVVGALVIISRWMHSDRGRAATATAAARR